MSLDEFCGSPLWQYNLTWNISSHPDFTPCFQETILSWVPALFLWLFAPFNLYIVLKSNRKYVPLTLMNLFRMFLSTVLCILSFAELFEALVRIDSDVPLVDYISPIVKSLTYVLLVTLVVIHRNRGIHTSGYILIFWFLMSVSAFINLRSLIKHTFQDEASTTTADWHITEMRFTLRIISTPIIMIQLILACIADKMAADPFMNFGEDYTKKSPESEASVLSLYTFAWLDSLMWLGYKRALTQEDLYPVHMKNRADVVYQKFERLLEPAIKKCLAEKKSEAIKDAASEGLLDKELSRNRTQSRRGSWIGLVRRGKRGIKGPANITNRNDSQKNEDSEEQVAKYVSVPGIITKAFWPRLLIAALLKFSSSFLMFASPLLLDSLITFISSDQPNWRGMIYSFCLLMLSIFQSLIDNREQMMTNVTTMRIKTCLTSALYRKTLRLSNQGKMDHTSGQVVNLMSVDAQRVIDFIQNFNNLFSAPIQLTIAMYLLYQQLGMAIFAGLGVMFINAPFNGWVALKLRELQQMVMRFKDKRLKLLTEIFNGIKVIKLHAWEYSFKERTEEIRAQEIKNLTSQSWYSAAITFAFVCTPFFVGLASFATYILLDSKNILDPNKVFVSLSLFNILRIPLALLPMLITNMSMYLIAVKRINKFLECDEIDPDSIKQIDRSDRNVIKITDGKFKWNKTSEFTLEDVNFQVARRQLVAVVGSVGSGKSSLLSAILGDMDKLSGQLEMDLSATTAYVPQEAWILNSTVKNNIMLNKVVNEERYQGVLEACALNTDLYTLPLGDQSEIGEKGINLSGGQKQRVSLARAVYADADVYLFDDPLSAVDADVGRHIFDRIMGPKGVLRDRTRVLVTNKLSVLPDVDYIYVIKDGKISESGTYESLLTTKEGIFSQLLINYLSENFKGAQMSASSRADIITKELRRLEDKLAEETATAKACKQEKCPTKGTDLPKQPAGVAKPEQMSGQMQGYGQGGGNLTGQEVAQVGSIGLEVHLNFIRTMGINFMIALCIYILSSIFTLTSNLWLSEWSNDAQNETLRNDSQLRNVRLGTYAALGISESFCVILSTILLNIACLRGSQILHNQMLSRILRAPMSWFNSTPSGRILNRFSKDIDTIDVTLRFNVRLLMVLALRSVTSLILICVGSVYSIIFIVPIVLLYFIFQIFYISTSRQLRRIESGTRSPIYTHFSETIQGALSIRAFKISHEFILECNHRIDLNNSSVYISSAASRWLGMRLECLGFIVVLTASLAAVLSRGYISPGLAGLSITYALTVTSVLSFLVRTYSDYETNVVSVERLLEYTRTPVEPEDEEEPYDRQWPANGKIQFENFSARYRPDLDLVIKKFNLLIQPKERIGLVGRTGAGKSSITLSLFRFLEAADGHIVIDDVDIGQINLRTLRSRISIIPQEPVMFTGTLRQNLDPTKAYSDEQIWRSIEDAHLGPYVKTLNDGLEHEIQEGGSNLSVGQRQLFCLARALLKRSKILVLDEATAAVDLETDNLIQKTIRREFQGCTILTIAHRLETIQDYDRVVVMDNGSLAEAGPPNELIKRKGSKFHELAKQDGLTN